MASVPTSKSIKTQSINQFKFRKMNRIKNIIQITCVIFCLTSVSSECQMVVDFESDSVILGGVVAVNDAYILPTDGGVDGQVLTTNGAGQSAWASPSLPAETGTYVYMATYVCGVGGPELFPVPDDRNDGQYQTAISIANPSFGSASITRYVTRSHDVDDIAIPPDSIRAPLDSIVTQMLPRFYSYAMTCEEVFDQLGDSADPISPIIEGFVIFESDRKLVVTATYTYYDTFLFTDPIQQGGAGGAGVGTSIDVEQIKGVFIPSPPLD